MLRVRARERASATLLSWKERARPRLVVVGSGWGGFSLLRALESVRPLYLDVICVSPRNHMLFTPLLASSSVGTLDFRSIAEPLDAALPRVAHVRAHVVAVEAGSGVDSDGASAIVVAESEADDPRAAVAVETGAVLPPLQPLRLPCDLLVLAPGALPADFGVPGVASYAQPLKELADARAVRTRLLRNVAAATAPDTPPASRAALLSLVVVGGGPTGVEWAAEAHDYVMEDLLALHPALAREVRITVLEAGPSVLSAFDSSLRTYTAATFARKAIVLRTGARVVRVGPAHVELADGEILPAGLVLWNVGLMPRPLVAGLPVAKDKWGHVCVDARLRTLPSASAGVGDCTAHMWALGDAAAVVGAPFAPTAQVAEQQGAYIAAGLIAASEAAAAAGLAPTAAAAAISAHLAARPPFSYQHKGSLAALGRFAAAADFTGGAPAPPLAGATLSGLAAFIVWRSAYLTKLGSWRNRIQVPLDWLRTFIFGRDSTLY